MSAREFFHDASRLGIPVVRTGIADYLTDESRFQGRADGLVRPQYPRQVAEIVALANRWNMPLTVVSGKTSLTGSCVPVGGVILDVKSLDTIEGRDPSRVGPGVVLRRYKDHVLGLGLFYPPDPTSEDSCTLGGNVACNASGALSYLYGPTRTYIRGMKIVLPSGSLLDVERGDVVSRDGFFTIPAHMLTPARDRDLVIPVPRRGAPAWNVCKSASGLYAADPMDLVDLFIGSEGILGITVELRTVLLPMRNPCFGLLLYLPTQEVTVALVTLLDGFKRVTHDKESGRQGQVAQALQALSGDSGDRDPERFRSIVPACMEWFSASVARFLSPARARRLEKAYGCLYVEQEFVPDRDPVEVATEWADLVELIDRSAANRHGTITTEVALDEKHMRQIRLERKGVPEKLNELIRPGMVKIGTDFSVPLAALDRLMRLYDRMLPPSQSYLFGHIGNAHLHVNMVPETREEEQTFRTISQSLAQEVCALNGSVSAEHGIGKLKRAALAMMLGPEGIEEILRIKKILDPQGILNRGNMVRIPEYTIS
jgi:D-lactate dehydrogenase (cytochrome)